MQKYDMQFIDAIKYTDGNFWFFDRIHMGLYSMDKNLENIRLIRAAREDVDFPFFASMQIYLFQDDLYITSQTETNILRYKIKEDKFSLIRNVAEPISGRVYNTVLVDNKILYIPKELECNIYVYDLMTATYAKIEWIKKEELVTDSISPFIFKQDDIIWIPVSGTNYIYKLNGKTYTYELDCLSEDIHVNSLCVHNEKVWITQNDGSELCVCTEHGIERIVLNENIKKNTFSVVFSVREKIVLLPRYANSIFIYDYVTGEVQKIRVLSDDKNLTLDTASLLVGYYVDNNKVYLWPWKIPYIYILDIDKQLLEKCKLEFSMLKCAKIEGHNLLVEEQEATLEEFIKTYILD